MHFLNGIAFNGKPQEAAWHLHRLLRLAVKQDAIMIREEQELCINDASVAHPGTVRSVLPEYNPERHSTHRCEGLRTVSGNAA